jgi:hypothetical protein
VIAALALACAAGQARAGRGRAPTWKRGLIEANWRLRAFERELDGAAFVAPERLRNGIANRVYRATLEQTGSKVIMRAGPYQSARRAARLHNLVVRIVHQLGREDLALPSAEVTLAAPVGKLEVGSQAMVTAHADGRFMPANAVASWKRTVSGETRVLGALADVLTYQRDRKENNVLTDGAGALVLIDHDWSGGHPIPYQDFPQLFHPGQALGYDAATYHDFASLPEAARELVEHLAGSSTDTVAREYHVLTEEARVVRDHARMVRELGLTAAIERLFGR